MVEREKFAPFSKPNSMQNSGIRDRADSAGVNTNVSGNRTLGRAEDWRRNKQIFSQKPPLIKNRNPDNDEGSEKKRKVSQFEVS